MISMAAIAIPIATRIGTASFFADSMELVLHAELELETDPMIALFLFSPRF